MINEPFHLPHYKDHHHLNGHDCYKESEIKKTNEKITPVKKVQKQNVQTGDESNGALWFTFMGLALLLIFLLVIKYIKGKRD